MTTAIPRTGEPFPEPVSEDKFAQVWEPAPGLWGFLTTVQNQPIGLRFIATAFLFLLLGGINALLMRTQLAVPNNTFLDPQTYNELFTMHGSTMMFLFTIPMIEGIATLVLPQMLGSRELPFPRLTSFAFWTFLIGGLIFYSSFLFNAVPDSGWFAYTPLSNIEYSPSLGMDFWLLGLNVAEIGAIAGGFEIIIAFFKMRGPGMTLNRIPIFAWAMMIMAFMMVFGFTPLIVGSLLLELDRAIGTQFYKPAGGGDPLLWQHIFWFFGHPEVYIQFLPAAGIVSTIVPVFAQRKLVGHTFIVVSLIATGFLSFGLWVHHMFATGLPELSLSFFTAASIMIAIPSGIQIFAWLATIGTGKPKFSTPFLFVLGFIVIFVLGGITGVMVASVPFDLQVHDSYFVVAHFHYVLIGGVVFPVFGGLYYWAPKFTNRMLDERLGKIQFWLMFIGFNLAFLPMHISGFLGMPRRVYTYDVESGLGPYNLLSTIGAFILGVGIVVFIFNFIYSQRTRPIAPDNPWNAGTLEWLQPTPTTQYGFRRLPVVRSRYPLWDQADFEATDEQTRRIIDATTNWPTEWRGQLASSPLDAVPQELFRVAGASIWPFITALGVMAFSFFLIFKLVTPAALALAVGIIALIFWHGEDFATVTRHTQEDEKYEALTGIPVRAEGSRGVSRGAMLMTILALTTAFITLLVSHMYLRLSSPQWPPPTFPLPDLVLPAIALVVLLLGVGAMAWASSGVRRDDWGPIRGGLAIAALLGSAHITIMALDLSRLPFDWTEHAYASGFWTVVVFGLGLVFAAVLMSAVTLFWALRSRDVARRQRNVSDIAIYWGFALVSALAVFLVVYILPYVY